MKKKYINLCFKYLLIFAMTLILVSCFIPEEFTIKIEVNNDGSYSFIYDGILTYLFARAAAIEAPLSKEDEVEMKKIENEFKEEPEFKKVIYIGKGQFEVLYEKTGKPGESFYFFDEQYSFFSIVYSKNDTIEISGFQLDKESLAQMEQMKLKIEGEFEILTDANVLKHNSTAKVKKIKRMDCYKWDVKSNLDPAPYISLTYQALRPDK